jgi:archaeosine synthase
MLLDSSVFVERVARAKEGADLLRPTYCPVAGLPHRLAFLAYCGFDLFDSIPLIMSAETGSYLTSTGVLDYGRLKELPCSCPACSSGRRDRDALLAHNYTEAENELRLVRHAISEGTLRELVENRVRADPWLVQNLRLMDLERYELQERHFPVKGPRFQAGSKESLTRPDVLRWMKRLRERYVRPRSARVLLLIPCSARKPYSMSQTHRRFREAVLASGRAHLVHEVVVTSPLGIVPRELELFYPAQDYDIPVTGHWDSDEKKMVREMVGWLIENQGYESVISHLGDEREPVREALGEHLDTSEGRPGSNESLQRLTDALRRLDIDEPENVRVGRAIEDMRSLCIFQFGGAGGALCDRARLAGKWPNLRIVREGEQLGMLTGERGMISLTMSGAREIARQDAYRVEIDDFVPKGNLFAVGVEKASPEIRIGDDVAVTHRGDVRAVGVARMTPTEMELAERGEAVHIRHVA